VSAAPATAAPAPPPDGALLAAVIAPTAPRSPAATPGNTTVKLTWRRPSSNGGAAINRYAVQRARAGGAWRTIAYPTTRSYTAKGLTNGTKYSFRIRAHNGAGWGAFSTALKAAPRTVPAAPRSPTATAGNASVKLTWRRPSSNGGAAINRYAVQRARAGGPWRTIAYPTTRSYTAKGLTNGTKYYFRIRAHNRAGWSKPSTVVNAVPRSKPTAPRSPTATPGNASVTLKWLAPSNNGGLTVDYDVEQADSSSGPWTPIANPTGLSHTATGLTNGTSYWFRIVAHNALGWSAASTPVTATPRTVPTEPLSLTASAGDGSVYLTWSPPSNDGGAKIDKYVIRKAPTPAGPWEDVDDPTASGYTLPGLTNGTAYWFHLAAHNPAGWGPPSAPVSAVPVGVPGAPRNLTATVANNQATLKWLWPLSDGGKPIDAYDIYVADSANGPQSFVGSTPICAYCEYVFNGSPGKTYHFTVYAHNPLGNGPSSTVSATIVAAPSVPTACFSAQFGGAGSKTLRVTWSPPSSDGGKPILFYAVQLFNQAPAELEKIYVWVPAATTHDFAVPYTGAYASTRVTAYNAVGPGPACFQDVYMEA
jgi:large repetitive protein